MEGKEKNLGIVYQGSLLFHTNNIEKKQIIFAKYLDSLIFFLIFVL